MSELGQNLTSSWVRAAGRFGYTPEKPLVMFYVEGDEDVPFWKEIIKPYLAKYDIQVCTNKAVNPDEGNGKTFLLKMSGLGTNKIVAVDADFDLLIDDYSDYTEMVRNHPYVINTTWYSLENILMQKVSSISLLKKFSRVFKNYFVKYLIGVSNKSIKPKVGFGEMLQKLNIHKLALEGDFSGIVNCEEIDVQDSASFQEKFDKMGIADADLWKLMRGHNLWNTIVKPVEDKLLNCKIHEIIQENLKEGNPIDRHKAMQTLGINCSVKDYLDRSFYYNQLELVSAPRETQNKLNRLFS